MMILLLVVLSYYVVKIGVKGVRMKRLAFALAAILLAGCSQQDIMNNFSSPQNQADAKQVIAQLRQGKYDAIENAMDPSLKDESDHQIFSKMAALIPKGAPLSVKMVGANKYVMNSIITVNTTFEYQFPGKWLLINVAFRQNKGARTIVGFNVVPIARSLEEENAFTLSGKNPLQYGVLALAVAAVLTTLYALVACIRTKMRRRKWLWLLFILFGFGQLWVNWTTGKWGFTSISIRLLSASAAANYYGPWIIAVSFPLGAIWFLLRRSSLRADPEVVEQEETAEIAQ